MTTTRPTEPLPAGAHDALPAPTSAEPPAPARRSSPAGRVLTAVGAVVAAAMLLAGALQLASLLFQRTTSQSATLAATDLVELVADGDVRVTVGPGDEVLVERTARHAWSTLRYEVTADDDRTLVEYTCGGFLLTACSTDLAVTVPEGTRVVVRASDGDARVVGAVGDVVVRSVDGQVEVTGARGDVQVQARDGDVRVADVDADVQVRGRDGSAWVAGAGGDVDVRTVDGSVDVRDVQGALTARATDGGVLVAAVLGDIEVRTVDGDVTVHGTGEPVALTVSASGPQRVEAPTDPAAVVRVDLSAVDGAVSYLGP